MNIVLYVVSTLKRSGPTNQLFNVIKNLDRTIFKPVLLTLSPEPEDSRWKDYEAIGVELYSLNLSRIGGAFLARSKVQTIVKSLQPCLIHSQGIRADVLIAGSNFDVPHVATIHNFPQIDYRMTYGYFLSFIMIQQHVTAMSKANKIIACSNSVERNLVSIYGLNNTVAIQNGVDQDFFYPIADPLTCIRKELGIKPAEKIWLSTGHFSELKDPSFLIDAWSEIESRYSDQHLVFLGSGSLFAECQSRASKLNNVHMLGRVSNVSDYLNQSNFFVTASRSEGLPMAAIEAMACGLPLLATNIEPYKEIFSLSPLVGEIYKLGDRDSFMKNFLKLKSKNYSDCSVAAVDLVNKKLNAEIMSASYQAIYKELLEI